MLWKQVFLSAALPQACLAHSVCALHAGCTKLHQQLSKSKAPRRKMLKTCETSVPAGGVGLFYQHIGGRRKGESRKQSSRAAVQALTALLCAEVDYLHFFQVKS